MQNPPLRTPALSDYSTRRKHHRNRASEAAKSNEPYHTDQQTSIKKASYINTAELRLFTVFCLAIVISTIARYAFTAHAEEP